MTQLRAGMVEYFDIVKLANPYLEGISVDNEQDRETFAQRYADSIWAWARTLLLNAFGGDEQLLLLLKARLREETEARANELENDFVFDNNCNEEKCKLIKKWLMQIDKMSA